jgi:hypothetical protein
LPTVIGLFDDEVQIGIGGRHVEAVAQAGFGLEFHAARADGSRLHAEIDVRRIGCQNVLLNQIERSHGGEQVRARRLELDADLLLLSSGRLEGFAGEVGADHRLERLGILAIRRDADIEQIEQRDALGGGTVGFARPAFSSTGCWCRCPPHLLVRRAARSNLRA